MIKNMVDEKLNGMTKEELIALLQKLIPQDQILTAKILGIDRDVYKVRTYMDLFFSEGIIEETVECFATRAEAQEYVDNLEYADLEEVTGPSGMNYTFHIKVTYPIEGAEEVIY